MRRSKRLQAKYSANYRKRCRDSQLQNGGGEGGEPSRRRRRFADSSENPVGGAEAGGAAAGGAEVDTAIASGAIAGGGEVSRIRPQSVGMEDEARLHLQSLSGVADGEVDFENGANAATALQCDSALPREESASDADGRQNRRQFVDMDEEAWLLLPSLGGVADGEKDVELGSSAATALQCDPVAMPDEGPAADIDKAQRYVKASAALKKRFFDNPYGGVCNVCDRLWCINDVKPIKNEEQNSLLLRAGYDLNEGVRTRTADSGDFGHFK